MIDGTDMNNLPPARWLPKNALTTKKQPEPSIARVHRTGRFGWGWLNPWSDVGMKLDGWGILKWVFPTFFMVAKISWPGDWMLHVWSSFGIFSSTRLKSPGLSPLVGRFCSRKSQAWESKSCWINCWVESPSLCPSEEDGIHTPVGVEFLQC